MKKIIEILMKRDDLTEKEAHDYVMEVRAEIMDALADGLSAEEIEDIFMEELGLEPDYLIDIL